MKPERWQQIEHLLQSALAHDPQVRSDFLAQACAGDESLRREVESLIVSHDRAGSLLETPLSQVAAELLVKGQAQCVDGQTIGHFEVLDQLGAGAMGEVYLAHDTRLGRKVALKLLPAEFTRDLKRLRRFEQEARAASALNHPNILTIHEIGHVDDLHFIATEFIDGQTLRRRMSGARLKLSETLDVVAQSAGALTAAHEAGIVHRDIKPENIMLRRDGYIKILDFGLAKLTERQGPSDTNLNRPAFETEPGTVMGTAHYMSPEQARGLEVDARADVFSLGVVLYEMIAGKPPFDGPTTSDVITAILKEEPVPITQHLPEVPAEVEWIVKKALAKDREERYQTVKDFHIDVKRLRQELELLSKLHGMSPSGLRQMATGTNNAGDAEGNLTNEALTREAGTDPTFGETKPHKRIYVSRSRAVLAGVAAIAIFSLVSFYAGVKRAPSPATPTFQQVTFRRGTITTARFAPDGETIVFSAAFDGKPLEAFVIRPGSLASTPLRLRGGAGVAGIQSISSTGEMAVLLDCELDFGRCRDGTLARALLSDGTLQEVKDNVSDADWSPDGKEMAIVRVAEGEYQLEYPMGKVLYRSPGRITYLRVSPTGDAVAFIDQQSLHSWGGSIMVVNRSGKSETLSAGWSSTNGLAWSPSGEEVWFSAGKSGVTALHAVTLSGRERLVFQGPGNLALHDISRTGRVLLHRGIPFSRMLSGSIPGSGPERNLSHSDWSTSADLSADGRNLLFYEWGIAVGGVPVAFLGTTDGSTQPVRLGQGRPLSLSRDGKWALTLREGSAQQLVLLPTSTGEPSLLPSGDIKEYHYASWFPDGKWILFTGRTGPGHGLRSYVQQISGGQPKAITEEGRVAHSVSQDGNRLFAWTPDKPVDGMHYLISLDQTRAAKSTAIKSLELGEIPIGWSEDADAIYVHRPGYADTRIYRLDLSSGRRDLLKEIALDPVGLMGLEVSPGGLLITPDGKRYVYTYWTVLRELFVGVGLK